MQDEMLTALGGEDNKGEKDWAKVLELIHARPEAATEKRSGRSWSGPVRGSIKLHRSLPSLGTTVSSSFRAASL
jgi:hypothetical protein